MLVNDYKEIFVGRVISDKQFEPAHVRVLNTYKGSISRDVIVSLQNPPMSGGSLEEGETYVFYSNGPGIDPNLGRVVTFWSTKLLSSAKPDELDLLDKINQAPYTGAIFGTLSRHLTALEWKPLPGVKILAARGRKIYSGTTNQKGEFEITGLPKGNYRIGADMPDTLMLKFDTDNNEPAKLEPHGCLEADLFALNNATIRGHITLPAGQKVEGTKVVARATTGTGSDLTGATDRHGRYKIVGLSPGEYVVGVNLGFNFPRAEAPFPATYYPGTHNLDEAKKFVIKGPAHFSDIDFSAPVAGKVLNLKIQAAFEDWRPVPGQLIGMSDTGYGIRGGKSTDAQGKTLLPVVRGTKYVVMAYGGTGGRCPAPVVVGPEIYPDIVHLVYSADGCRQAANVTAAGFLHSSVRSEFSQAPVSVNWSDGSSVYEANVTMISDGHSVPFVALFQTGRGGQVDVPIPLSQEFRISADVICSTSKRDSNTLLFNTESGIRWRELDPHQEGTPVWNTLKDPASPIHLVLQGTPCTSRNEPR